MGGLAIAGERSLQAARESSAASTASSFQANATTWQRSYGGFPLAAADLGIPIGGALNSCTADGEIPQAIATGYGTGFVQGGYTFLYVADTADAFNGSACGGGVLTPASVAPSYTFVANSVDGKTKNFCSDSSGEYYYPAGTPMIASTGKGCLTENASALAIGQ